MVVLIDLAANEREVSCWTDVLCVTVCAYMCYLIIAIVKGLWRAHLWYQDGDTLVLQVHVHAYITI